MPRPSFRPRPLPPLSTHVAPLTAVVPARSSAHREWVAGVAGALRLSLHTVLDAPDATYAGPVERAVQDLVRAGTGLRGRLPATRRPAASRSALFGAASAVSEATVREQGFVGSVAALRLPVPKLEAAPAAPPAAGKLALVLDTVSCQAEHTELGDPRKRNSNQLYLSGAIVVPSPDLVIPKIEAVSLGNYDEDDVETLRCRLGTVDLAQAGGYPLTVVANVVLVEKDTSKLEERLDALYQTIRDALKALIEGQLPDGGDWTAWTPVFAELLMIIVDFVHEVLMRIVGDDVSSPVTVPCETLASADDTFSEGSATRSVTYTFGIGATGKYRLSFHWELVDA